MLSNCLRTREPTEAAIVFSGSIVELADRWYRALTVMLAYAGMGG